MDFDIIRSARAVLHVKDLEASRRFYVDALGFIETEQVDDCIYLRGLEEHTHHSLVLKKAAEPVVEALSYKVATDDHLEALSELFIARGQPVEWLGKGTQHALGRAFRVQDSGGLPLEFFAEMETVERLLQRYDLYRGSQMQRIDHFNCMVTDVGAVSTFYQEKLGFACSEYTDTEEGATWAICCTGNIPFMMSRL